MYNFFREVARKEKLYVLNLLIIKQKSDRVKFENSLRQIVPDNKVLAYYTESTDEAIRLFCENPCRYDAVFLPVPVDTAGVAQASYAAESIRKASPYVQIVYMSSFGYIPFSMVESGNAWFLKIPVNTEKLEKMLDGLESTRENNKALGNEMLMLKCGRQICFIPSSSILYARKCRNGSIVITEQGKLIHSGKLDEFEKELTWTFCRCHSSYIVNFRHVVRLASDGILMDDGEQISISRAYRKNVNRFIEKRGSTP